jgi:hypothetical protein
VAAPERERAVLPGLVPQGQRQARRDQVQQASIVVTGAEAFTRVSSYDCNQRGHVVTVHINEQYEPTWVLCIHCDKAWKVVAK